MQGVVVVKSWTVDVDVDEAGEVPPFQAIFLSLLGKWQIQGSGGWRLLIG